MIDGNFTLYTIQHRPTHKSPWGFPNDPLIPELGEWAFSCWDRFGHVAEPWTGSGNDYHPAFEESYCETMDTWAKTGYHGWWNLKFAIDGLLRLRKNNGDGSFTYKDSYGRPHQTVRYEFRVVSIKISRSINPVNFEDVVLEWSTFKS